MSWVRSSLEINTFVIRYSTALIISAFCLMAARKREHSVYGIFMNGSASCCTPPDYPYLWVGLFRTFPSALALVPKSELKPLDNRHVGPFQLQPSGWCWCLQLSSAQIRFRDGHGNSLYAGKLFQLLPASDIYRANKQ